MKVLSRARTAYVLSLVLSAVLLIAMAIPAFAARPAGKGKPEKAPKAKTSQVTEDNDSNDGNTPNNVVDDGDNRHPSGKDRSVERGGSGNQGKSASDPDGDTNGGADKPGGSGGIDLADQDGNNGCGNDDDFEDDNNGNCGPKAKKAKASKDKSAEEPCTPSTVGCDKDDDETCSVAVPECTGGADGDTTTGGTETEIDGDVLGAEGAESAEGEVEGETDVAGVTIERSAPLSERVLGAAAGHNVAGVLAEAAGVDESLAATGAPAILLGALALAGVGIGTGMVRRGRKR